MWDIKHKSGTLLFTTSDKSVADNRRTMGWVVEMKKLTVEKAQELIEQLSQGERSCREEYYLQALEAFVGCQWIACSDRMPDEGGCYLVVWNGESSEMWFSPEDEWDPASWGFHTMSGERAVELADITHWRPLPGAPL